MKLFVLKTRRPLREFWVMKSGSVFELSDHFHSLFYFGEGSLRRRERVFFVFDFLVPENFLKSFGLKFKKQKIESIKTFLFGAFRLESDET